MSGTTDIDALVRAIVPDAVKVKNRYRLNGVYYSRQQLLRGEYMSCSGAGGPRVPTIRVIQPVRKSDEFMRSINKRRSVRGRELRIEKGLPVLSRTAKRQKRFRSLTGLEVDMTPIEKAAEKLRELKPEPLPVQRNRSPCSCVLCVLMRRTTNESKYCCPVARCRDKFDDYVDMFEHQIDTHGCIDANCRALVAELHDQERGVVAYPPSTVYAGQQFLSPWRCPELWTEMDKVDAEYKTLLDRLTQSGRFPRPARVVWASFLAAYLRAKAGGVLELKRQHRVALEHYNSSLKFPVGTRSAHELDPCPSVAVGRNWLTSTEREDDLLTVEEYDDVEIVLIDTTQPKPAEKPTEASSPSRNGNAPTDATHGKEGASDSIFNHLE